MKKRIRLLALGLCLLMLWGCSLPGSNDPGNVPQVTLPNEDQGQISQDKTREFGLCYQSDGGFNPYTTTRLANRTPMSLLYQGLFTVTSEYKAEPVLCKSYTASGNLKTYIFTLEEASFSDGSPLEAADVVASLQAAMDSPVYGDRLHNLKTITATSQRTLEITLATAYESLPVLLDIPIVRQEDVASDRPLGTGAYALSESGGLSLRRRQNWWSDYKPPVDVAEIPLTDAANPGEIRDEFEFGRTDLVCTDPGANTYVEYRCDYELWECASGIMVYLACNTESGVFSNDILRSALTHGIDREALVDVYQGFAQKTTLPAAPTASCYDGGLAVKYDVDTEAFRSALVDSGLAGKTARLVVNSSSERRVVMAERIAQQLNELGLLVSVNALSHNEFRKALRNGDYEFYLGEIRLSPNFDLSPFFAVYGAANYGGMASGSLNKLNNMALENSGNYYDLFEGVMEDGRLCPLMFRTYAVYTTRGILSDLLPALDHVLHNSNSRQLSDAFTEWIEPTEPPTTEATEPAP